MVRVILQERSMFQALEAKQKFGRKGLNFQRFTLPKKTSCHLSTRDLRFTNIL